MNGRDQQAAATSIANSIRLAERHYGDTVNQRNLALNWAFGAEAKVTATENRIDSIQNKIGVDERALVEADKRPEDAKKLGDQAKIRKEGADVENRQATLKERRRKLAAEMAQLTQDKSVLAQARANAGRANATVNSAYWNLSATAKGINTTPFGRICMEHVMDKVAKGIDPDERVKLSKSKAAIQELKNKRALVESLENSKLMYKDRCFGKDAELDAKDKSFCESLRKLVKAASSQKQKLPAKADAPESTISLILPSYPAVAGAGSPAPAAGRRYVAAGQLPWLAAAPPQATPPIMVQ